MPLINCKVELKLKLTKEGVLSVADADNTNANFNEIVFTVKILSNYCQIISKRQPKTIKIF